MNIRILQLIEGAKEARGLVVVIDVFRAFTMACFFIGNGATRVVPVGNIEIAYDLKRRYPEFILVGERHGKIMSGFDYGNSPTHIENIDFTGKSIIQTTSAGTQGIANAQGGNEIITGSFVNARAIEKYIRKRSPKELSLVCMGHEAIRPTEEDTLFAEYLRDKLLGKLTDFPAIVDVLRSTSGKRFFDPANFSSEPPRDFELSLALDKFDFVLRAEKAKDLACDGLVELRKAEA